MPVAFQTHKQPVCLEMTSTQDSEVSTLGELVVDLERAGLVNFKLSGHNMTRNVHEDHDQISVQPMDEQSALYFRYYEVLTRSMRPTNAASGWGAAVLRASPMLREVWRLNFDRLTSQLEPRKPLWFLRAPLTLAPGECRRVL